MTNESRGLERYGYSPNEAAFLRKVARFSGCFLSRHICPYYGAAVDRLTKKVVGNKHAKVTRYGSRMRVYHLRSRLIEEAIGTEEFRHRVNIKTHRLRARLMGLDYVLLNKESRFLPTGQEKQMFFCGDLGLDAQLLDDRLFSEGFPIHINREDGRVSFCYVDTGTFKDLTFPSWLSRLSNLIRSLQSVEVVYVADTDVEFCLAEKHLRKHFPPVGAVREDELGRYFNLRQDIEQGLLYGKTQAELDDYLKLTNKYSAGRYQELYEAWKANGRLEHGSQDITFKPFLIPHSYRWMGTLGALQHAE